MNPITRTDRAVLFDLDDTVLVDEDDVDACFARITADVDDRAGVAPGAVATSVRSQARRLWQGSPLHPLALALGISSWEGLAADFVGGHEVVDPFREWAPAYRVEAWTAGLADFGAAAEAGELAERYRRARRSAFRLFPDALDVIDGLRAEGWRVAVVTNGPPDLQRAKVTTTGLLGHIDALVISGELGVGKPERAIFEAALAQLNAGAEAAVMVGDSLERDMAGAAGAGIRGIWRPTRRARGEWETAITTLSELPALLA